MRKRQPNRTQLAKAGIERIEDPARDVQMRHRVAIEQQQIMTRAVGEGQNAEKRRD